MSTQDYVTFPWHLFVAYAQPGRRAVSVIWKMALCDSTEVFSFLTQAIYIFFFWGGGGVDMCLLLVSISPSFHIGYFLCFVFVFFFLLYFHPGINQPLIVRLIIRPPLIVTGISILPACVRVVWLYRLIMGSNIVDGLQIVYRSQNRLIAEMGLARFPCICPVLGVRH